VASDIGNALARKLGILYLYDQPSRELALSKGVDMGQVTGTGTEAETILDSVRKLVGAVIQ
jgi:hypothetical protein